MHERTAGGTSPKIDRRNYLLNIIEGILYIGTAGFLSTQTTLPAVVEILGGDTVTIGLIPVIGFAALFVPQLLSAHLLQRYPVRTKFLMVVGIPQRSMVALIGCAILFIAPRNASLALTAFLLLYLFNQLLVGMSTPAWYDMITKVTPPLRRGKLLGMRSAFGAVVAILCGFAVAVAIERVPYPLNYAGIFFGAAFLQFCSLLVQRRIREHPTVRTAGSGRSDVSFAAIRDVLNTDANFRNFIIVCILLTASTMSSSFFIGYGFQEYSVSKEYIGTWTMVMMAGQILGSLLMGYIGDRFGFRWAVAIASTWMIITALTSLLASNQFWYGMVFFFLGLNYGMDMMSRNNMAIELAPDGKRPVYVALLSTVVAPFYVVSLAAGALIGRLGYRGIFWASAFFAALAVGWLFLRVSEPRDADV